ncbi:MAG: signal peptide peptidase SppA [Rhodocyclales bacterium]|nr:signal peptide peptidase SppA [Rhodocyclales bacterium]
MNDPQLPENDAAWQQKTLEKLIFSALEEQRARRRWSIFFKAIGFVYLLVVLVAVVDWGSGPEHQTRHTALISLQGMIEAKGEANAENLIAALNAAYEEKNVAGVVLRINSPGGSPVQSSMIYDEMRRLRAKYPDKPLYAVVEDMCASGGYFVAVGAERIYANKASIVGSIGVLMDGFGFTGGMDKLGVERRLMTAGANKGFMDPFSPQQPQHKEYAQQLLNDIHRQFIEVVKEGRGNRLKETPELFSGLIWTGAQGRELGLIDEFGSVDSVARDVIKAEKVLDYSVKDNIAERFAKRLGASTFAGFWKAFSASAQDVSLR